MLKSMTGYGRITRVLGDKKISCEIKSLNSKQIDINFKLPANYREYELEYRSLIAKYIVRGKVDVVVAVEEDSLKNRPLINKSVIKAYYEQIKNISNDISIPEPCSDNWFRILLSMPDVYQTDTVSASNEDSAEILSVVKDSLLAFDKFRQQEGNTLESFLKERIKRISLLLTEVDKYEKERVQRIKERILDELKQLTAKSDIIDQNRLEQEMIFYIEKLDISEEKSRLKCHLEYFVNTIDAEQNQGKKLGFISQEIGREINTLGSKSNHSEIQKIVVMMKDELEQIKEQVLNVL
ncbi:MAG: YicC family protein [Bacteroidetes bacterium]|jgi:TIGR00255 family protein|nr:MAG: YicC family protein [Bacteroidota bacterium]